LSSKWWKIILNWNIEKYCKLNHIYGSKDHFKKVIQWKPGEIHTFMCESCKIWLYISWIAILYTIYIYILFCRSKNRQTIRPKFYSISFRDSSYRNISLKNIKQENLTPTPCNYCQKLEHCKGWKGGLQSVLTLTNLTLTNFWALTNILLNKNFVNVKFLISLNSRMATLTNIFTEYEGAGFVNFISFGSDEWIFV